MLIPVSLCMVFCFILSIKIVNSHETKFGFVKYVGIWIYILVCVSVCVSVRDVGGGRIVAIGTNAAEGRWGPASWPAQRNRMTVTELRLDRRWSQWEEKGRGAEPHPRKQIAWASATTHHFALASKRDYANMIKGSNSRALGLHETMIALYVGWTLTKHLNIRKLKEQKTKVWLISNVLHGKMT